MFLFKCCQQFQTGIGYELQRESASEGKEFVTNLKEIDPHDLQKDEYKIIKIKKSEYEEVYSDFKDSGKKFIDQTFPANEFSLGDIQGFRESKWKRISEIIQSPVLFGDRIEPNQVIQGSLGDCYFLSAFAALAEK